MTRARSRFVALKRRSRHSEHMSTPGTPAAGVPAWSPGDNSYTGAAYVFSGHGRA
jgi:hypothetical protein